MNNGLFEHMATFVAVAQTGSLTAASIATGIAQPTISRQLASLEKHLGVQLLQRSTRAISLTIQGENYLQDALRLISLSNEAEAAIKNDNKNLQGRLRIACSNGFGRKLLIPLLSDWQILYPRLHIELVLSDQVSHLIEERVDVAFRTATLPDSSLIAKPVGNSRRVIVASKNYVREKGTPSSLQDLQNHQCILFSGAEHPGRWKFLHNKSEIDINVDGRLICSTVDALQDAVLAGLGIAIMPRWFWTDTDFQTKVVELLTDYHLPLQTIHAVTTTRHITNTNTRYFIRFLEQSLSNNPCIA